MCCLSIVLDVLADIVKRLLGSFVPSISQIFTTNAPSTGWTGCHVSVGRWKTSKPPTRTLESARWLAIWVNERETHSYLAAVESMRQSPYARLYLLTSQTFLAQSVDICMPDTLLSLYFRY
jgi:hypothetical protein